MKRRTFALLAGMSMPALRFGLANAQTTGNAGLLTTTLTPFGAERAGSADGKIPAWTGGYSTLPSGWQQGNYMPDFFADDQPTATINSSNMQQFAANLTDGVMAMMQKFGFSINVYPTRRSACAPQEVYDNIAKNLTTAQLVPQGARFGFTNAFGGAPFPIPNISDPLSAGAQIMWNHITRWSGYAFIDLDQGYAVSNGQVNLADRGPSKTDYPYYAKGGSASTYNGYVYRNNFDLDGPTNEVGEQVITWKSGNYVNKPDSVWELLNGQGRVRKAPEVEFDTPSSFADGIANYDEYLGFTGSIEKYDWKYLGKQEMFIPYNNNAMYLLPAEQVHLAHFLDPKVVRWELHRVWVVEATLHPGERNVLARRRMYIDEDTWTIGVVDAWDANNNLYKVNNVYNMVRPDVPGTVVGNNAVYNLQTGDYATIIGAWNEKTHPSIRYLNSYPDSTFDPMNMAASSQY